VAVRALARFAAAAPVPVFAAAAPGWRERVEDLSLRPGVELVATPRHAVVLLVAGEVPAQHRGALHRVHDQLPRPRATLWWGAAPGDGEDGSIVAAGDDPLPRLEAVHRALLAGDGSEEDPWLPDAPPRPWRGIGPHGQGGEGMMGGAPYGRPMAMTGDDLRDGLALDRLMLTLGPFYPPLPPGLELMLTLQGDVVQEAEVLSEPYAQPPAAPLRRVARLLAAMGAPSLAERTLRLAAAGAAGGEAARFARSLRRAGVPRTLPAGEDGPRERLEGWLAEAQEAGEAKRSARGNEMGAAALTELLPGMEWGRAIVTIVSLDPASPADGGDALP
jgi:hypothetical protein